MPVSGTECLVQPVLKLWRTQEQRKSSGQNMGGSLLTSRISSSLPPLGYQSINSTATITLPSSPNSGSPAADSSTLRQDLASTPVSKQWTDIIEIKDEDKNEVISKRTRECRSDTLANVRDDVARMENSLSTVESIASLIHSVFNRISKSQDDGNSSGLSKAFFSQLRSSQTKAQGLGMRGTFVNPLWIMVFEEHVHMVQTMSGLLNSGVIGIVPADTTKRESSLGMAAETMADVHIISHQDQQTYDNGEPMLSDEQAKTTTLTQYVIGSSCPTLATDPISQAMTFATASVDTSTLQPGIIIGDVPIPVNEHLSTWNHSIFNGTTLQASDSVPKLRPPAAMPPSGLFPHVTSRPIDGHHTVNTPGLTLRSTPCSASPASMATISTTSVSPRTIKATATASTSNAMPNYRLSCNTRTVHDIWKEWTAGFEGGPSIVSLHEKYDLKWLAPEDRAVYRENRSVLLEAGKLVRLKRLTPMDALGELESARIKAGQDIREFAKEKARASTQAQAQAQKDSG